MRHPEFQRLDECLIKLFGEPTNCAGSPAARVDDILPSFREDTYSIRKFLSELLCSDAADLVIQRHFFCCLHQTNDLGLRLEDHLKRLSNTEQFASDSITKLDKIACELVKLTYFLLQHLPRFISINLTAHPAYTRSRIAEWKMQSHGLRVAISEAALDPKLAQVLQDYLNRISVSGSTFQQTFYALAYYDYFLMSLSPLSELPVSERKAFIDEQLIRINFNHLSFLQNLQQDIRKNLLGLNQAACVQLLRNYLAIYDQPPHNPAKYDQQWPSLCDMMSHWLREELRQLQPAGSNCAKAKMTLQTSVAHLACLLRICHEDELSGIPLSDIFRWVSAHLATKRQKNISTGSLNKQFYTVNQFTAARVRDRLLKLAERISLEYFPVVAATSITICFHREMILILPAIGS